MIKQNAFKRSIDLVLALPLFAVTLPICLILMIVIRLESAGSPLFVQSRVGRGGRTFRLFKLRTMSNRTPDLPSHQVGEGYITKIGAILRRTKLDELPQVLNVLVGSMSFVGPRPCLPSQLELIDQRRKRNLLGVRPGITGPAQVEGIDMSDPRRLAAVEEAYYFRATVIDDFHIMWRTLTGAGSGDAARGPID